MLLFGRERVSSALLGFSPIDHGRNQQHTHRGAKITLRSNNISLSHTHSHTLTHTHTHTPALIHTGAPVGVLDSHHHIVLNEGLMTLDSRRSN